MRKALSVGVLAATMGGVSPTSVEAAWGPGKGDIYWNGRAFFDSYFTWYNLTGRRRDGKFESADPSFEMDIAAHELFFRDGCTAWTDLPHAYDDCPTAGVSEGVGDINLYGVGTFHLLSVRVGRKYYAKWTFGPSGSLVTTPFELDISEGTNFCWPKWDTIWCQQSLFSYKITETEGDIWYGTTMLRHWDHPEW